MLRCWNFGHQVIFEHGPASKTEIQDLFMQSEIETILGISFPKHQCSTMFLTGCINHKPAQLNMYITCLSQKR